MQTISEQLLMTEETQSDRNQLEREYANVYRITNKSNKAWEGLRESKIKSHTDKESVRAAMFARQHSTGRSTTTDPQVDKVVSTFTPVMSNADNKLAQLVLNGRSTNQTLLLY